MQKTSASDKDLPVPQDSKPCRRQMKGLNKFGKKTMN